MQHVSAKSVRLIFHRDHTTPAEFVISLLQTVFAKSAREVRLVTAKMSRHGKCSCGPYPAVVAKALRDECERRIREAGHPQRITAEEAEDASDDAEDVAFTYAYEALEWHFEGTPASGLVTRVRQFPLHMQADVQVAINRLFASSIDFFGVYEEYRNDLDFGQLLKEGRSAQALAPPQYLDVDVGEAAPVKCLKNGLWLCDHGEMPYAVVLARFREYSPEPLLRIEIAVHSPIAARSCPLMPTTNIAAGRSASWCTDFLPCTASRSS